MNFLLLASFSEVFIYVIYVLIAVLVLLAMITVHELGHYISGKIFGFGIEEFAIGFGPKLYSRTKKDGEKFSIRLLPLGGFCAFKGEDAEDVDPTAFNNKKPWQRLIVLLSGAFMNYLFSLLIIALMFSIYGYSALVAYKVDETPSIYGAEYDLQERDVILKANGKNVYMLTDLMTAVSDKKAGDEIALTIIRNKHKTNVIIKLRNDTDFENVEQIDDLCSALGIIYTVDENSGEVLDSGLRTTGVKLGVFNTIGRSFEYSFKLAGTVLTVFRQLITGSLGIGSVGGTVTTISVTAEAIKTGGLWSLLNISSFIGVNLAIFNVLPFPALDGSRALFTLIEWIRKKPVNRRVEGIIHTVGFVLLLAFALLVDLQQCF